MIENNNIVQLDVIPIYKNEMYPAKKDLVLKYMYEEIKQNFWDYDVVIILEKGKVIEIIK